MINLMLPGWGQTFITGCTESIKDHNFLNVVEAFRSRIPYLLEIIDIIQF